MSRSLHVRNLWNVLVVTGGLLGGIATAEADDAPPGARTLPLAPAPSTPAPSLGSAPLTTYDYTDTDIVTILSNIANATPLELVIGDDVSGNIRQFKLENVTPEEAIKRLADIAGLQWQKLDNGVYIIHKKPSAPPLRKAGLFDLVITDGPYKEVFNQIAKFAGIKILLFGSITGNLKYINLKNTTVEKAVDTITRAAGFKWQKTREGDIVVFGPNSFVSQLPIRPAPPSNSLPIIPRTQNQFELLPKVPRDSVPFQFNGGTFYHVPLT